MKKQKEIIAFWVIVSIVLAAFFIPAVSAGGEVYTEASVNPDVIVLGTTTQVELNVMSNITMVHLPVDIVLVTDRSGSMRQSGWELIKEGGAAHTFNDVSVPKEDWSSTFSFDVSGSLLESGLAIEAENYVSMISRSGHDWEQETSHAGYSGTGYMRAIPDSGDNINSNVETTSTELQYTVDFPEAGTYYVWVRGYKTSGTDDSVHVGIDGVLPSTSKKISSFTTSAWKWSNKIMDGGNAACIQVPTADTHTINVWMREDGFRFDKLILTKDQDYVPSSGGDVIDGKLAAQVTWDRVPGYNGSEASEVVINLQRPDGTWIFAYSDKPNGASNKVDPPDSVGRSNEYYSGICTKPQALLIENPEAGTWKVAVYGWNLRPKTNRPSSMDVDISVYIDHSDNSSDDLDKTETSISIDAAIDAAKKFIANMNENDRAGYVKFSTSASLEQDLTYMNDGGKSSINAKIDSTGHGGGTAINTGIDKAKDELVAKSRGALKGIVLLTDGQNDAGTSPVLASAQAAKDANITIFTIGLTAFVNEEMLKEVATKPDYYYYSPTGVQLREIYDEISERVQGLASDVKAKHILPANVEYVEGSASIRPDINGQTLEWGIGDLTPLEPWSVTFDVKPLNSGNQSVNVVPFSNVTYIYESTPGSVPFPEAKVFVNEKTPPVAEFRWTPEEPKVGEDATFSASASYDPDGGSIVSYKWSGSFEGSGETVTHVFGTEGNYSVTLIVTDDEGVTNSTSKVVEVVSAPESENQQPVAIAKARRNVTDEWQYGEVTVPQYEPIMFDGTDSYDLGGRIVNYTWEFKDGNKSTLPGPVHVYWENGSYEVKLSVQDDKGAWSTDTLTITVTPNEYNDSFADIVSFNVEPGSGPDTNSTHIGKTVTIGVITTGDSSVTYHVFAGDYEIGTGNPPGTEYFTWIPMSSGEYKIKVTANVGGYHLEWILDPPFVDVWIKQVK